MRMGFKIKSATVAPAVAKAAAARKRARVMMTEAARMDVRPYVPRVSGDLAGTADVESQPERGLLIYGNAAVPYARAQYYGLPLKTRVFHPHAVMEWFAQAKPVFVDSWERVAKRAYKEAF